MDLTQIPDPYKALGVPKDADAAQIKSTYRKLVLKCHPDKVTDESLKAQKQEEFHKIQQAYEVIGDESKRELYDSTVRLEALQREKLARSRSAADAKPARYETRTQAPAGSHRYEEHKSSSRTYDDRSDRYYEDRARSSRYDTYEAYPKHTSPRSSREKDIPIKVTTRGSTDRTRSEYKKKSDKESRRDRKFVSVDSDYSSDEKTRYEAGWRDRTEKAAKEKGHDEARRAAADARRKAEERRSYEDSKYERYDRHDRHDRHEEDSKYDRPDRHDRQHKLKEMENFASHYIRTSKAEPERPSPSRTTSSRDVRPEYYSERSSRRDPRRSSARPKDRVTSSSGRDRKVIEIMDWEDDRKMPSFKQSSSSPAEIHIPSRTVPTRSYTEASRESRHAAEVSPPPSFRRADTLPSHSSSRRKEATPLRSSAAPPSSTAYASVPAPSPSATRKVYSYTPSGGVREETNGHRTVLHEPGRFRARSPSPLSRPPIGANRPVEVSPNFVSSSSSKTAAKPSLGRAATMNVDERGRSRLYGEIGSDALKRENARRQTSFSPDQISYAYRPGPEDVRWAPRRSEQPPPLSRHPTSVY